MLKWIGLEGEGRDESGCTFQSFAMLWRDAYFL